MTPRAFCVVAVWLMLLWHFGLRDDATATPAVTRSSFDGDAGFGSLPELLPAADGLWQPPRGVARGIVLILHACTHSARDFWKRAPECPRCTGLAEEVALRRAIVAAGYGVVAFSSANRQSGCWAGRAEIPAAQKALAAARKRMPSARRVIALGVSSGGAMAAELAAAGLVDGVILGVAVLPPRLRTATLPPLLFHFMARDKSTASSAKRDAAMLQAHGRAEAWECAPLLVADDFFSVRTAGEVSHADSAALVRVLRVRGGEPREAKQRANALPLVGESGELSAAPFLSAWQSALEDAAPAEFARAAAADCDRSACAQPPCVLSKPLNRAWAVHEYCSDLAAPSLRWFEEAWAAAERDSGAPRESSSQATLRREKHTND